VAFSVDPVFGRLSPATVTTGASGTAATGADLAAIYSEIAGVLKTEAGVNTAMSLDFGTVRVNDEDREGETVFTYVHEDDVSTTIENWVENRTPPYVIYNGAELGLPPRSRGPSSG